MNEEPKKVNSTEGLGETTIVEPANSVGEPKIAEEPKIGEEPKRAA